MNIKYVVTHDHGAHIDDLLASCLMKESSQLKKEIKDIMDNAILQMEEEKRQHIQNKIWELQLTNLAKRKKRKP